MMTRGGRNHHRPEEAGLGGALALAKHAKELNETKQSLSLNSERDKAPAIYALTRRAPATTKRLRAF